jgi:hypothetical protein
MSDRIYVATRKGLFTLERGKSAWSVAKVDFLGDPVTMVLRDRRDDSLYAALRLGHFGPKIHRSRDGGSSWQECAAPSLSTVAGEESEKAPSVDMIWSLETGGADEPGVLWAGTIPGALFRSTDRGDSWRLVDALWNRPERAKWGGGGYDHPGIHSICVDPRDSAKVWLAVSSGGVWYSDDRGASWSCRANGMRAAYMPPELAFDPNVQDPHRLVACAAAPDIMWVQHHNGIFYSDDAACSWREIKDVAPSVFGFAVVVHPRDPRTAWFVPAIKDERRVPVDGQFVVTRTRDGGRSFETLRAGLPAQHSYDLVYRHGLDIDGTGTRLVIGSTTGNMWVSENGGDSWQAVSHHLPPIYGVRFA